MLFTRQYNIEGLLVVIDFLFLTICKENTEKGTHDATFLSTSTSSG